MWLTPGRAKWRRPSVVVVVVVPPRSDFLILLTICRINGRPSAGRPVLSGPISRQTICIGAAAGTRPNQPPRDAAAAAAAAEGSLLGARWMCLHIQMIFDAPWTGRAGGRRGSSAAWRCNNTISATRHARAAPLPLFTRPQWLHQLYKAPGTCHGDSWRRHSIIITLLLHRRHNGELTAPRLKDLPSQTPEYGFG